ncbi:MAG: restriction endonuclease subunit S, partial [Treponema sp.]|nr:restriction endonuclease subunit S [Treponema sp.]
MVAVTTGANYPAIKDSDILNYEISNPPLKLQQQFASFVQQIDKSKFEIWRNLELCVIIIQKVFLL